MRGKTDLEKLKTLAHVFLDLDIRLTSYSPMIVDHPFTNSGLTGIRGEDGNLVIVDLINDPKALAQWRTQVGKQIDRTDSAMRLFLMVNKTYALTLLKHAEPYLSEQDFGQILSTAWMLSEAPHNDPNLSKQQLASMFRSVSPEYLMDEEELRQYRALEDTVTVYRGVTPYNRRNVKGLSWTLDRERAEWFAHRFGEDGTVYTAQISKEYIFAIFNGRNEAEVVVDPKKLENVVVVPGQQQGFSMTM